MAELKLLNPVSKVTEIKQLSGYPRLKPAYILTINLGAVTPIGTVAAGSSVTHIETGTGTLTTAEGYDDPIEGEVIYGADWLLTDPSNEHARPNVKLLIKTNDGVILNSGWTGVAQFSKPINDMWAGDPNTKTFPFGISATVHTFETGDPKYKHLERKIFVGNGRFVIHENPRSISVESRISEVIASNDSD